MLPTVTLSPNMFSVQPCELDPTACYNSDLPMHHNLFTHNNLDEPRSLMDLIPLPSLPLLSSTYSSSFDCASPMAKENLVGSNIETHMSTSRKRKLCQIDDDDSTTGSSLATEKDDSTTSGNLATEKDNESDDSDNDSTETPERKKTSSRSSSSKGSKKSKSILTREKMDLGNLIRYNYIKRFFREHPDKEKSIIRFIRDKNPSSVRVFEHGITGYPRKLNISLDENGNECPHGEFCVAEVYYKFLPKYEADPCRRGICINYTPMYTRTAHHQAGKRSKAQKVVTTIPQLMAFINWCTTPVFKYIKKYKLEILKELNDTRGIKSKKDTSHIVIPDPRPKQKFKLLVKPIRFLF